MANINLLSNLECLSIVSRYLQCNQDDVKLYNYEIKPTSKSLIGYMGEYFFLSTKFSYKNKDHEKQFFIKSIPLNSEAAEAVENMGAFTKEVSIYKDLFQEFSKYSPNTWRPQYYLVRSDIIVMENLMLSGFRHIPSGETFSNECLEAALKSLAEMHGSSLIFEYKTNKNIGELCPSLNLDTPIDKTNGWYIAGLKSAKTIASIHPKFQSESYQHFINEQFERSFESFLALVEEPKHLKKVLCHRDVWTQNILFKFDDTTSKPTSCVYIDFQIGRYHCPALDVWLLFYYTTRRSQRDDHLEKWFKLYYDHLSHVLEEAKVPAKEILSWDEFHSSTNEIKLLPLAIVGLDAVLMNLPGDFAMNLREKDPELFRYYFEVDRTDLIFKLVKENPRFKELAFEIVEEVIDCFYELSIKTE